jgi:hypothetical protein
MMARGPAVSRCERWFWNVEGAEEKGGHRVFLGFGE